MPERKKIKKEYNPAVSAKMSHQAHKPIYKPVSAPASPGPKMGLRWEGSGNRRKT